MVWRNHNALLMLLWAALASCGNVLCTCQMLQSKTSDSATPPNSAFGNCSFFGTFITTPGMSASFWSLKIFLIFAQKPTILHPNFYDTLEFLWDKQVWHRTLPNTAANRKSKESTPHLPSWDYIWTGLSFGTAVSLSICCQHIPQGLPAGTIHLTLVSSVCTAFSLQGSFREEASLEQRMLTKAD